MGCVSSKTDDNEPQQQQATQTMETRERALKYSGRLLPLEAGHLITIAGKSFTKADYFNIFFGSDDGLIEDFGDIQLHIAVNFTEDRITRNSYTVGEGWGEPETDENIVAGNYPNPIKPGDTFKMEIFVDEEMFHITIDSKPYCTYSHRQSIKSIHRINVYGAIEKIHQITHMTKKEISKQLANSDSLVNVIPPTKLGSVLSFSGMPQGDENGIFEINLMDDVTRQILFKLTANFGTKKILGNSQDENLK
jgi:hypothetical protein